MTRMIDPREALCRSLTDVPQSAYALCLALNCSQADLRKTFHELTEWGVPVVHTAVGYALEKGTPAPKLVQIKGWLGADFRYLGEVDSTQDELKRMGRHGSVLVAERQRAGRGRRGRVWNTQQQSLAVSIRLEDHKQGRLLPLAVGIALWRAVAAAGVPCGLKWPNDLLSKDGKKLAGILIESDINKEKCTIIIGIGINIDCAPEGAAAIADFKEVVRSELLENLLSYIEDALELSEAEVLKEWQKNNVTIGKILSTPHGIAKAKDITCDGLLLVKEDGSEILLTAGDINLIGEIKI